MLAREPSALRALPVWPDTWYVVARSADIARGAVIDGAIARRPYVIFRTAGGELGALDAHCPHMGAHLRSGEVLGDRLRCPLHHWTLDRTGQVCGAQGARRQGVHAWPVAERFGLVFLYPGRGAPPELPRTDAEDYAWITGEPVVLDTDWRAMVINGFDLQHMLTVHQRALTAPARFSRTGQGALRLEYATRVTPGGGLENWLVKWVSRDRIRVRQTCHGTIIVLESDLGRTRSCAVFGFVKTDAGAQAHIAFGTPRNGPLWRLRLRITRWSFLSFLRKDYAVIEKMRLKLDDVDDPGVQNLSAYLRSLPELER